uniref:BZIP domain-containing protein n=1 Tax=Timema cristinae TaxID=61476 RepID=A0A7R9CQN3_TIMCR|nr:unnamed protein product [Timema cristinae]
MLRERTHVVVFVCPAVRGRVVRRDAKRKNSQLLCLFAPQYVDLDEFLSENGIPVDGSPQSTTTVVQQAMKQQQQQLHHQQQQQQQHSPVPVVHQPQPVVLPPMSQRDSSVLELVAKRERSPSPSDTLSPTDTFNPPSPADSTLSLASSSRDFDPRTRAFSDEELKPQPMIKKSRKQLIHIANLISQNQHATPFQPPTALLFVPDEMKDEKYWARRRKNNMAAKRSRDARRIKENQIALRAGFLEKENMGLRQEMDRLKKENMLLRDKLSKFSDV